MTITFRAKASEYGQAREDFTVYRGVGYKVPALSTSHVSFSDRDSLSQHVVRSLGTARADASLARVVGGKLPTYVWADGVENKLQWSVTPIGKGFMADVSLTVEVA